MRKTRISQALALALLLAFLVGPQGLFAESVPPEHREELFDAFYRTVKDPQYDALVERVRANPGDRSVVDQYLAFLPISPLAMLKIDMEVKRYELGVPKIIFQYHERWKQLHPEAAKRYYPEEEVLEEIDTATEGGKAPRLITAASSVGPNRNVAYNFPIPPTDYQGEIQVVINPNNPNQIVAAANTWDDQSGSCGDFGLQAVFYSNDGGVTWGNSCPPDDVAYGLNCSAIGIGTFGSDPALAWNKNNEVFLNYMMICFLGGNNFRYAMVVARSANGGATWNAQGIVKNSFATGTLEDKNFYAIDTYSSSPFFGRHYTCWDRGNNEKFAYSTNNGANWTEVDLPTAPGGGLDLGCEIAVQKNGTVHVIWNTLTCGGATCSNERTFYTRSTNGGASWLSPAVLVVDTNLTGFSNQNCPQAQNNRCISPFGSIEVDNSGGPCDGTLYVTYTDFPSGFTVNNSDVFVRRSTNGGNTWSAGVRVNDDGSGGRIQFHPFLVMDQIFGSPVVAWHDARLDPANRAVNYFVARSFTCGQSFEPNIQASQPSAEFNNSAISSSNLNTVSNPGANPNQYGEYLGLDAKLGKAYLAWTDTRHYFPAFTTEPQKENVGFVVVDLGPDQVPPAAPTGLTATSGSGFVVLDWNDNTEADLAAYRVFMSLVSGGPYTQIGTVTSSAFTVTGLVTGQTYYFRVTAMDISGLQSPRSLEVSATP